ncbi:hypothetical protein [Hyalangium versicolor]|uniref:hypothetical protein n=1 Tax=Hyalangium versicolor TaxID=2861190 RepID=UPI001CCCD787|nr:hypothetical protein [Hyalangium versicolor]
MQAFQAMMERDFVARLCSYLRREYTDVVQALDDDVLRLHVKEALQRGRSHGLHWESSLAVFIATLLVVDPDFDRYPAVASALHSGEPDENELVLRAIQQIPSTAWDSVLPEPEGEEETAR